jgi:hypothetical protein
MECLSKVASGKGAGNAPATPSIIGKGHEALVVNAGNICFFSTQHANGIFRVHWDVNMVRAEETSWPFAMPIHLDQRGCGEAGPFGTSPVAITKAKAGLRAR